MKYRPEWRGRLHYNGQSGPDYGKVTWDGKVIGFIHSMSQQGAKSPGGMVTNTVFLATKERSDPNWDGIAEHASMTLALESLIPKE